MDLNEAKTVVWKTQDGRRLQIGDMETSHLFNTVRMLWNHFAPAHYQLHPFRKYRIRMRRTYILTRLEAMLTELSARKDELTEQQLDQLAFMTSAAVMREAIDEC